MGKIRGDDKNDSSPLFGWAGRIVYIDLSRRIIEKADSSNYVKKYAGGRILAARLAWECIQAGTGPFDPDNCVLITTGPLAGTIAPSSGRTIMSSVSPVPRPFPWYTHSTLGGGFAGELKAAGYDAVIISGTSDHPAAVIIEDDSVSIKDVSHLWGVDALDTQSYFHNTYGEGCQVLTIGEAGENRVVWATVQHNFDNAAGHSGFGAVWGAKKLKALSVKGSGGVRVADPDRLFEVWRRNGRYRINSEQKFLLYDAGKGEHALNRSPGPVCTQSCVNNCHQGIRFTGTDGRTYDTFCIGPLFLGESLPTSYNSKGAGIRLPLVPNHESASREALVEQFNRLGLDLWMRVTLHTWLTAVEDSGLDRLGEYPIEPRRDGWFSSFVNEVTERRGLGAYFSDGLVPGVERFSSELSPELIDTAREITFGYGFQAHREGRFWDQTPLPFWLISAMMYANETRDPTIGSHSLMHLSDILLARPEEARKKFTVLGSRLWGLPDALLPNYNFQEKAVVAVWTQRQHMLLDSLPLCDFAFPMLIKPFNTVQEWQACEDIAGDLDFSRDVFNAITGLDWDEDRFTQAADRGLAIERILLLKAGRTRDMEGRLASHFALPCRDDGTRIDEPDFKRMMDVFYQVKGWNIEEGRPSEEKLRELGLQDMTDC